MSKVQLSIILLIILCLFSIPVFSITKTECEAGGGTWIIPTYKEKPDPREPIEPFCQCGEYNEKGYLNMRWDGAKCVPITEQYLCEKTKGEWKNNKCICENGQWVKGYGCEYIHYSEIELIEIIILGVLFLIGLLVLFFLIKKVLTSGKK